jgi:4'-phosphopantetheinyl transferase EntD
VTAKRETMIQELLPDSVVAVEVYGDDPSASLLPEEAAALGWAVESRKREFTTGRTCARQALLRLGLPITPILRGARREPVWPSGVVGSITHCDGYRAAAVALHSDVVTIGIDAEPHSPLPANVLDQVCLEREKAWCAEAPRGVHWERLVFSAKESVYKAWFAVARRFLEFHDVVVTFAPEHGTFRAQLLVEPPKIAGCDLTIFHGRFAVRGELILTATTLVR